MPRQELGMMKRHQIMNPVRPSYQRARVEERTRSDASAIGGDVPPVDMTRPSGHNADPQGYLPNLTLPNLIELVCLCFIMNCNIIRFYVM